jgi:hypothetical protein
MKKKEKELELVPTTETPMEIINSGQPTELQTRLKTFLQGALDEIAKIDGEIRRLKEQIHKLENDKRESLASIRGFVATAEPSVAEEPTEKRIKVERKKSRTSAEDVLAAIGESEMSVSELMTVTGTTYVTIKKKLAELEKDKKVSSR